MKFVYCHGSKIQGSEALCGRVACPDCGCGFTYDPEDVYYDLRRGEPGGCPKIYCPECKADFFIESMRSRLLKP